MPNREKSSIYMVADPADGVVRYVGQAVRPHARLKQHVAAARQTAEGGSPFYTWLRELLDVGRVPALTVIDWVTGEWEEERRPWPCEDCTRLREKAPYADCDACKSLWMRNTAERRQWRQQVSALETQWIAAFHQAGAPLTNAVQTPTPRGDLTVVRLRLPSRLYGAVWGQAWGTRMSCEDFMVKAIRRQLAHCRRRDRQQDRSQLPLWRGGELSE